MTEPFEADFLATALDPDEIFQANLPWFVNGTLDAKEKAEMEDYIQAHPTAVKQLAAYREFSAAVRDQSARSPAAHAGQCLPRCLFPRLHVPQGLRHR